MLTVASPQREGRFELKYLVDEPRARAIRAFIRQYLDKDAHTPPAQGGYWVYSLYLDHPSLRLCRQTIDGIKNRFKLRIRFYDDAPAPTGPVFLEVKRRENNAIYKDRAVVARRTAVDVLRGVNPTPSQLLEQGQRNVRGLHEFCRNKERIGAVPAAFTIYQREAYVSPNGNDVRLTFDRNLQGVRFVPGVDMHMDGDARDVSNGNVIFEIKYTGHFPAWLCDLVKTFDLARRSVPKYILCVNALALDGEPAHPEFATLTP
ncbi:MAG: polyphosphate polymerase domain-containing protein [Phycisphaerae bacterium]|jgi:hypothetical protein|nr:polyphosphate polymerase domain-containing protein [Phycisphaerae bacterium]